MTTSKRMSLNNIFILLGAAVLCGTAVFADDDDHEFIFPSANDYPQLRKTGQRLSEFIPKGWTIIGKTSGDLNGDGRKDIAAVIVGHDKKFIQENEGLGSPTFDTNPRVLIVLFSEPNGGYRLAEQNNTIEIPQAPTMAEPFADVNIRDGILRLDFCSWLSAGSWSESNASYQFRWNDNNFVLIGADYHWRSRGTGEEDNNSYNFLTGKEKLVHRGISDDDTGSKTIWKNLKRKKLPALSSFKSYEDWMKAINNGE